MTKAIRACPCGCGTRFTQPLVSYGLSRYGHGAICSEAATREAMEGDFIASSETKDPEKIGRKVEVRSTDVSSKWPASKPWPQMMRDYVDSVSWDNYEILDEDNEETGTYWTLGQVIQSRLEYAQLQLKKTSEDSENVEVIEISREILARLSDDEIANILARELKID